MGNVQDTPLAALCQEECRVARSAQFKDPYEQQVSNRWYEQQQGNQAGGWRPSRVADEGRGMGGMGGMKPVGRPWNHEPSSPQKPTGRQSPAGRQSPRSPVGTGRNGSPLRTGHGRQSPRRSDRRGGRSQTMLENPYEEYSRRSGEAAGDGKGRSSSMFANPFKEYASLFGGEDDGAGSRPTRRGGSGGPGPRHRNSRGPRGEPGSPYAKARDLKDGRGSRGSPKSLPDGGGSFLPSELLMANNFGWQARAPHDEDEGAAPRGVREPPGERRIEDSPERRRGSRPESPKRVEDTMIGKGFGEFLKRGVAQASPKKELAEMVPSKDGGFISTIQKGFEGIFGHLATSKEEVLKMRGPMPASEYEAVPGDDLDQRMQLYARQIPRHLGGSLTIYRIARGEYKIGEDEVHLHWQSRCAPPSRENPGGSVLKEAFVTTAEDEKRAQEEAKAAGGKGRRGQKGQVEPVHSEPLPLFLRHSANVAYDLQVGQNAVNCVPESSRLSFATQKGTLLQDSDADAKFSAMQLATEQARKRERAALEWRKNKAENAPPPNTANRGSFANVDAAPSPKARSGRKGGGGDDLFREPDDRRDAPSPTKRAAQGSPASKFKGLEVPSPPPVGGYPDMSPLKDMPLPFGPLSVPGLDPALSQLKVPPPNWGGFGQQRSSSRRF